MTRCRSNSDNNDFQHRDITIRQSPASNRKWQFRLFLEDGSVMFVGFRSAWLSANYSSAFDLSFLIRKSKLQGSPAINCVVACPLSAESTRPLIPKYLRYHRVIVKSSHIESNYCATLNRNILRKQWGGLS